MEWWIFEGWGDDSIFNRRTNPENDEEMWKSNGSPASGGHQGGAFTTGRSRGPRPGNVPVPPPPAVKPRSQVRLQTTMFENHKKVSIRIFHVRVCQHLILKTLNMKKLLHVGQECRIIRSCKMRLFAWFSNTVPALCLESSEHDRWLQILALGSTTSSWQT